MDRKSKYRGYNEKRGTSNKSTLKKSSYKKNIFRKKRRVIIKRRVSLSIFVALLLSMGILSFIKTSGELTLFDGSINFFSGNKKGTTIKKDSGIVLEENEYFKKYIITFDKDIETFHTENGDNISITLDKSDLKDLKLNENQLYTFGDINIANTDAETSIKVNSKFTSNNYIFEDEINKNQIEILVSKKKNPYDYKVTLDPGHGGEDPGVNPGEISIAHGVKDEKIYTLDISLKTERYLRYNGINVTYTRDDDVVPGVTDESADLARRAKIANDFKSDVLVSVHVDSFVEDTSISGITMMVDDRNQELKDKSIKLAEKLKSSVLKDDSWSERETRKEPLQVLNEASMPSVLIECGFLSSIEDVNKLNNPQVIENLAKNISSGIIEYLKENNKDINAGEN